MKERLQKILAVHGIASRRAAETLILDGRVTVNGVIVRELGAKADSDVDLIAVDGQPLPERRAPRVLMLNKPVGYISTCHVSDEDGSSILELIPADRRYFPVGRLDRDSSGLILLTDDGDLAYRLTHPKHGVHKVYQVETTSPLFDNDIDLFLRGIRLEEGLARALEVRRIRPRVYRIVLGEGRKRQIRRMLSAVNSHAITLHRIQIGSLRLGALPEGRWRELKPSEIALLETPVVSDRAGSRTSR